jgi:7-cyano-7-deazaguanine synthase
MPPRAFHLVRPLIADDKTTIVRRAMALGVPIHLTCYLGGDRAYGTCNACQLRVSTLRQVGVIDPAPYAIAIDRSGCAPYRAPQA